MGRFLPIYSYVGLVYCLPFFFTFMMLKNGVNAVWLGSEVCSLLFLALLLDPINLLVCFFIGFAFAALGFMLESGGALPAELYAALPVFAFALAGGLGLNHSEELIKQQNRMRAVATVASSIAHEMRTPLLSIKFDAEGMKRYLPALLEAHDWASANGWSASRLGPVQRRGVARALERIEMQTTFANAMINILLMNIREQRIDPADFKRLSVAEVVDRALDHYPFKADERQLVEWRRDGDFTFVGSDLLMMHVLFNLLKNALRAVAEVERGAISIALEPGPKVNRLLFRDTGTGIAPEMLPHIFEPFHSGAPGGNRAGIGLAFCRRVIESFNGTIICRSESGKFTEFEISLPAS